MLRFVGAYGIVFAVFCLALQTADRQTLAQYAMPPQAMPAIQADVGSAAVAPSTLSQPVPWQSMGERPYGASVFSQPEVRTWQMMPSGLMYREYLASPIATRLAAQWVDIQHQGWYWNPMVGGRFGVLRYGTQESVQPSGIQFDMEAVAFPRLQYSTGDLVSNDYRIVLPLTFREGPWEGRIGYEHYCSHLGDEYLIRNPTATRDNYVRDAVLLGVGFRPVPELRLYGEASWAFIIDGKAMPWQLEMGVEYSSFQTSPWYGLPFIAANGRLRQEVDFGGSFNAQAGLQWRGANGQLLRIGATYMNGMSDQVQFSNTFEQQIGFGLWYDY